MNREKLKNLSIWEIIGVPAVSLLGIIGAMLLVAWICGLR